MSEVKRYDMSGYGDGMIEVPDGALVYFEDHQSELAALREENERLKSESFEGLYNAVIDERDALREELTAMTIYRDNAAKRIFRLRAELTAAEQRNADLVELLRQSKKAVDDVAENCEDQTDWSAANSMYALSERIEAALKPTESGASE